MFYKTKMNLESLFYIPHQESIIIEILIYIFVYSLYKNCFTILNVELKPTNIAKQIYLYQIEDSIIYSCMPEYWKIILILEKVENITNLSHCPFQERHLLIQFIDKIIHYSQPRKHLKMIHQLYKLMKQLKKEIQFECLHCKTYQKELENLPKNCYFPFFYISILDPTNGSREEVDLIAQKHQNCVQCIQKQIRNEKIIHRIMEQYQLLFYQSYNEFRKNPEHILDIKIKLKNDIQAYIMKTIPFLNVKPIYFMDWIDQLFLLQLHLKDIVNQNQNIMTFIKKIIILLQLLFTENFTLNLGNVYLNHQRVIFDKNVYNKNILSKMYEYHPILRGDSFFLSILHLL